MTVRRNAFVESFLGHIDTKESEWALVDVYIAAEYSAVFEEVYRLLLVR